MDKITITQPRNLTVPDGHNNLHDACECEVDDLSQVSDGYHTIAELYAIIKAYETGNKLGQTKVRQIGSVEKDKG